MRLERMIRTVDTILKFAGIARISEAYAYYLAHKRKLTTRFAVVVLCWLICLTPEEDEQAKLMRYRDVIIRERQRRAQNV